MQFNFYAGRIRKFLFDAFCFPCKIWELVDWGKWSDVVWDTELTGEFQWDSQGCRAPTHAPATLSSFGLRGCLGRSISDTFHHRRLCHRISLNSAHHSGQNNCVLVALLPILWSVLKHLFCFWHFCGKHQIQAPIWANWACGFRTCRSRNIRLAQISPLGWALQRWCHRASITSQLAWVRTRSLENLSSHQ